MDRLQKQLAARQKATEDNVTDEQSAAKAAELDALERDLTDEATRFEREAEGYEQFVKELLASAKVVTAGAARGRVSLSSTSAIADDVIVSAQVKRGALQRMHEREITAMEAQNESTRRAAAARLAWGRAAARAAQEAIMRMEGKNEEEIAKELAEVGAFRSTMRFFN